MIEVKGLTKSYRPKKGEPVQALKGINLQFEEKGLVFILGKSGSGKSTLLNMLGGLDQFDQGEIIVKGKSSKEFAQSDFDSYRNTFIGFIFQEYNILNDFTVGANIALAMELQGKKPTKETLNNILRQVDLEGFADRKPNELSGGQKQRVAIARALIKNPEIIMADEPTGALDSNTGKQVFDTLKKLAEDKLVIVVSHDREFAEQYGDRVIEMKDGNVISDIKKYTAVSANINEGIQIIDDKIIHIKSGYELTAEDMNMINEYLKKNTQNDSFISLDVRTNDKIKQAAQIDDQGNQQAFKDTKTEELELAQYDGSKLNLIKSKLPFKSSLKMAAGSLKKKPIRLAMTVLLSTVSFSLFGLANTMSSYDKIKSGTDSIIDSNVNYTAFTKEKEVNYGDDWSYYTSDRLMDQDVETIKKKFPENFFATVADDNSSYIDFGSSISDLSKLNPFGEYQYYPSLAPGVTVLTEELVNKMDYTLSGNLPKNDTEIVMTKFTAESFVVGGYLDPETEKKGGKINSAEDMIGKKVRLSINSDKLYTITGILDTKFDGSRYEVFTQEEDPTANSMSMYMLQSELITVMTKSFHNLIYTNDVLYKQVLDNNMGVTPFGSTYDILLYGGENEYSLSTVAEFSELNDTAKDNVVFFDKNKTSLKEGEIILSSSVVEQNSKLYHLISQAKNEEELKAAIVANKDAFTAVSFDLNTTDVLNDWKATSHPVKVVGVYVKTNDESQGMVVVNDGFFKANNISEKGKYPFIVGNMPENRAEIQSIVEYSFDNGIDGVKYTLNNCTSSLIGNVNDLVETARGALVVVGAGFAIFAGLMLMNFITTSIAYRKREIGILRAVGARGGDVFAIFFKESAIIALINWVFALFATGVVVTLLNNMFRNDYNFAVTVFHFGALQVGLMLILSLTVAFVASFFPVYNVSKKKPIEVIRKN
ncbi:MAG: ATP-binding cassette domain-containing protein [bacterium]|nr:ATP-binding cassette domain-containing protein [bacterium]